MGRCVCQNGYEFHIYRDYYGYFIGANEDEDGWPLCRCRYYHRLLKDAKQFLKMNSFNMVCDDNKVCRGCHGYKVEEVKKICILSIEDILNEISEQIENMEYLKEHQNVAQSTIFHETPEYIRGAINLLTYMKQFIENHSV